MHLEHPGYPSFEQIRAIERAARRAQAREMAQLFRAAAQAVKSLFARLAATPAAGKISHA
jgi:hypothetical protein